LYLITTLLGLLVLVVYLRRPQPWEGEKLCNIFSFFSFWFWNK
jgi:formate-dependent nitrite reductase membrane component NrfD